MKLLVYFMLAYFSSVRCDDSSNNYYIVEKPDDPPVNKPFKVYWNVPTMQCTSKKVPFEDLFKKYGIIQNKDDRFIGDKVTILYDPGRFPAIFKNESNGKYKFRNGGVPQEGDLQEHLLAFRKDIDEVIPDKNFNGIGIIDFESWRPVFRQNFGKLVPYKDVSYEIEKKLHPWWPKAWIEAEAKRRFEEAGRKFMQTTISVAKQMRPKARWGYYGFPYCFNMAQNNMVEKCPSQVIKENDQTYWLWSESTVLLPSIYREHDLTASQLTAMVRGRVEEAARVRRHNTPILPYFWYKYRDGGFITQSDLSVIFNTLYKSDASGFLIWGSSKDVDTVDKCVNLLNYVEKILGPTIASYTEKSNKQDDETMTSDLPDNVSELNISTDYSDDVSITDNPNSSNVDESALNYYTVEDEIHPEIVDSEKPLTYNPQTVNDMFKTWFFQKDLKKNSYNHMDLKDVHLERIIEFFLNITTDSQENTTKNPSIKTTEISSSLNYSDISRGMNTNNNHVTEKTAQKNIIFTSIDNFNSKNESLIANRVTATENPTTTEFYTITTNSNNSGQYYSNETSSESNVIILNLYKYLNTSIETNEESTQENITFTSIDNFNSKNESLIAKRVTATENPTTTEFYTITTNSNNSGQYYSNETSSESNVIILNLYEYLNTSIETTDTSSKLNHSDISREMNTKNNDVTEKTAQQNIKFTGIDDINTNNEYLIFLNNDKTLKPQKRQSDFDTNTEAYIDVTTENEFYTESETFTVDVQ